MVMFECIFVCHCFFVLGHVRNRNLMGTIRLKRVNHMFIGHTFWRTSSKPLRGIPSHSILPASFHQNLSSKGQLDKSTQPPPPCAVSISFIACKATKTSNGKYFWPGFFSDNMTWSLEFPRWIPNIQPLLNSYQIHPKARSFRKKNRSIPKFKPKKTQLTSNILNKMLILPTKWGEKQLSNI